MDSIPRYLVLSLLISSILAQEDVKCGWTTLTMPSKRSRMAVDTSDDLVVFAGGNNNAVRSNLLEILNTTSMTWSTKKMQNVREAPGHGVSNGWFVYYGGEDIDANAQRTWEAYNFQTGSFLNGSLESTRIWTVSGSVAGKVVIAGGINDTYEIFDTVDIFDGYSGTWSTMVMPEPLAAGESAVMNDKLFVIGGYDKDWVVSDKVLMWYSTENSWDQFTLSVARRRGAASVFGTKMIYAGGDTESNGYCDGVDIYESSTGVVTSLTLLSARMGAQIFHIGEVMGIAGGIADTTRFPIWEMFNLKSGKTWTVDFGEAKFDASAVNIPGMAMVVGGSFGSTGDSNRVDIYSCTACSPGSIGSQGYLPCSQCSGGKFSAAGSAVCSDCPAGKFSVSGSGQCSDCSAGYISDASAGECKRCGNGTFSEDSLTCVTCPVGHFSTGGVVKCSQCSAGTFSDTAGASDCLKCPTGTESAAGSTACYVPEKPKDGKSVTPGEIAGAAVGAVAGTALIMVVIFAIFRRKQNRTVLKDDKLTDIETEAAHDYVPIKTKMRVAADTVAAKHKDHDWEIPFSELIFTENNLVGTGNYGEVYYGEWRGIPVAIKKLRVEMITGNDLKHFREEITTVKNLRPHLNVVQFYGGCTRELNQLCLVAEYLSMGSLVKYMKEHENISKKDICQILTGAAAGLGHLHSEGLVHRDIAARNILLVRVENKLVAKISDFGLSRMIAEGAEENHTHSELGPTRWMAPEALKEKVYSMKSDVWSFGVLCWEAVNKKIPYEEYNDFTAGAKVAYEGVRLPLPNENEWPQLHQIMSGCFKEDPHDRFDFNQIVELLKSWEASFDV